MPLATPAHVEFIGSGFSANMTVYNDTFTPPWIWRYDIVNRGIACHWLLDSADATGQFAVSVVTAERFFSDNRSNVNVSLWRLGQPRVEYRLFIENGQTGILSVPKVWAFPGYDIRTPAFVSVNLSFGL
jgi:hypothetical protein